MMKTIIKKFSETQETGLLLLDMPTGSGKTYQAIQYLADELMDSSQSTNKYFFITPLKKNLPYEELKHELKKRGQEALCESKVLLLKPIAETVMTQLTTELQMTMPQEIIDKKSCQDLIRKVNNLHNYQEKCRNNQETKQLLADYLIEIEKEIQKTYEPKFRELVINHLKGQFKTAKQRLEAIKYQREWQWVGKLYPSVFTSEKQIIFMSMDKFILPNQTLIEPAYYFHEKMPGAVLIIDEFDATKKVILNQLIQQQKNYAGIDIIALFSKLKAMIEQNHILKDFFIPAKQRLESKYRDKPLEQLITDLMPQADYIFDKYQLQFHYRTRERELDEANFLFHDYRMFTVFQEKNQKLQRTCSKEERLNHLDFVAKAAKSDIGYLMADLQKFLQRFCRNIDILATNYLQRLREQKAVETEYMLDHAIHSTLQAFHLSKSDIDYLTAVIKSKNYRKIAENQGEKIVRADFDLSFYEQGFRYFSLVNDLNHDLQTKFEMVDFTNTPEKLLITFAQRMKVIGISATATLPTVLGNYDLAYLHSQLMKRFHQPNADEQKQLQATFTEAIAQYDRVEIKKVFISGAALANDWESIWLEILGDRELAQRAINLIMQKHDKPYIMERYIRTAKAYQYFLRQPKLYSFLCLMTKMPNVNDFQFDREILKHLFQLLELSEQHANLKAEVVYLGGSGYEQAKTELIQQLGEGKKIFVISTYATVGAGQNLHYPIPQQLQGEIVAVNEFSYTASEKDFDGLYLDKPTHLLTSQYEEGDDDWLSKRHLNLFYAEYLYETGEITHSQKKEMIRNILKNYGKNLNLLPQGVYENSLPSVQGLAMRILIQAVGRICRTKYKSQQIHILVDERITNLFAVETVNGRLLNPEFIALKQLVQDYQQECEQKQLGESQMMQVAANKSIQVNSWIHAQLSNWSVVSMERWELLREYVLKHPTLSQSEWEQSMFKNFYIELPSDNNEIYYEQEHDYTEIRITLTKQAKSSIVSAQAARLASMLEIPGVRAYFEAQGYATNFGKKRYIMTPPLFNNIYKGALGEIVGKLVIESQIATKLIPIKDPKLFELFDFQVEGQPIYIDFKHWSEKTKDKNKKSDMSAKIERKLQKCEGNLALIINIFGNTKLAERVQHSLDQQQRIVSYPGLYDQMTKTINHEVIDKIRRELHDQNYYAPTTTE